MKPIKALINWIKENVRIRKERGEIYKMTERDLRDLGVTRWDLLHALNTHRT